MPSDGNFPVSTVTRGEKGRPWWRIEEKSFFLVGKQAVLVMSHASVGARHIAREAYLRKRTWWQTKCAYSHHATNFSSWMAKIYLSDHEASLSSFKALEFRCALLDKLIIRWYFSDNVITWSPEQRFSRPRWRFCNVISGLIAFF